MIELTPLARPYAKALFASTLELDATEETGNDLKLMAKICLLYTSPSPRD